MSIARDKFDAALRQWSVGDVGTALDNFSAATTAEPAMSDAWLGRIAAGDTSLTTLQAAHENSRFLFREIRRVGWSEGQLAGSIECPKYVVLTINSRETITLAYAAALITDRQYRNALDVLDDPTIAHGEAAAWRHFLDTCAHFVAERWPDITAAPARMPRPEMPAVHDVLLAAVTAMAAVAAARLGHYQQAINLLPDIDTIANPYIRCDAALARAWSERALDHEEAARNAFGKATIDGVLTAEAAAALADETLRLPIVSKELIAHRSDPWDVSTQPSQQTLTESEHEKQRQQAGEQWRTAIDDLIGHTEVKDQIQAWRSELEIEQIRAEHAGRPVDAELGGHLVFLGPAGTGKTTWARIFKDILFELGMIPEWKFTEVTEEDLVQGWVSQTAQQTREVLERALGGVLFIDEAYRLAPKVEGHSFGSDAINTLLKYMEDKAGELVVIAAGYPGEMRRFLNANQGFASRFHRTFKFEGYTPAEVRQIGQMFANKRHLDVDPDAWPLLETETERLSQLPNFGNGRYAREVINHCRSAQAERLRTVDRETKVKMAANGQLGITTEDMRRALTIVATQYEN